MRRRVITKRPKRRGPVAKAVTSAQVARGVELLSNHRRGIIAGEPSRAIQIVFAPEKRPLLELLAATGDFQNVFTSRRIRLWTTAKSLARRLTRR